MAGGLGEGYGVCRGVLSRGGDRRRCAVPVRGLSELLAVEGMVVARIGVVDLPCDLGHGQRGLSLPPHAGSARAEVSGVALRAAGAGGVLALPSVDGNLTEAAEGAGKPEDGDCRSVSPAPGC